ncbi:MAG TPA: T9SS type A sorting domain-containing protein [Ignavibacteria bacterium]|nr:T9SS type A sorting domain-containing protein [Ignavibacteria bacterium]
MITTPYSNCDGISLDRNDNVYISTWGIQSVARYDINFSTAPVIVVNGLSNPADIYVNKMTDTLAIPNAGNSTVVFSYLNIPSAVNHNSTEISGSFKLGQNYPNPFNPVTNLEFGISNLGFVSLIVYDVLGNEVRTLINENKPVGNYEIEFNGSNLPSGIYYYTLSVNGVAIETRRMTLLK